MNWSRRKVKWKCFSSKTENCNPSHTNPPRKKRRSRPESNQGLLSSCRRVLQGHLPPAKGDSAVFATVFSQTTKEACPHEAAQCCCLPKRSPVRGVAG